MKVLFTADLHIKVGQRNVPREWQKNRYIKLFNKLRELQKDVDLVVLGGDIFDKIPNMEELELYFTLVSIFTKRTIIFDGNHEATRKGKTFLINLAKATNRINKNVEIIDGDYTLDNMDFIPYTNIKSFDPSSYTGDILLTHVRGRIEPHVVPEIDLDKLSRWKRVFAGDLHAHSNSQLNIVYPGSPLSTSFHRKPIINGVIIFDSENTEYEWIDLKLPQLIRKTVDSESQAIPTMIDHTIYEIVGNMAELSRVDMENEFIDKKIISKPSDANLKLSNMSIPEELALYLHDVIGLGDTEINEIKGVYNDYIKNS